MVRFHSLSKKKKDGNKNKMSEKQSEIQLY